MHLASIPNYSDLFDGLQPSLNELLGDIPSRLVVAVACAINAEIHLGEGKKATDKRIVEFLLQRQHPLMKLDLYTRFAKLEAREGISGFFATNYVVALMEYCFDNYRDFEIEDTTPLQELNIFKAYVILANQNNDMDSSFFDRNRSYQGEFFHKFTWPLMAEQFQTNQKVNPISEMVRGIVFLNYFQRNTAFKQYLDHFLAVTQRNSPWHYVMDYLSVIQESWKSPIKGILSGNRFKLALVENHEPLFQKLCLEPGEFATRDRAKTTSFSSIRAKPLFKYDQEYFVLDWNALAGKLYDGLIFDFFNLSGISSNPRFKNIGALKRLIGPDITEGFLFQKLLSAALQIPYSVLKFDDKEKPGMPDAYFRVGNKIILFEIKDAFFPDSATASKDFLAIKAAIDSKYNQSDKGTGQIIKQLSLLKNMGIENFQDIKSRNLTVYPVIIYTDHMFGLPGFNDYLQTEFAQRLTDAKIDGSFKQIRPLTFIDIRFLIDNLSAIRDKDLSFIKMLDAYQDFLIRCRKKVKRTDNLSVFFELYQNFEHAMPIAFPGKFNKREDYVKTIVDTLQLTEGMPLG
jgi:hypothetical protein